MAQLDARDRMCAAHKRAGTASTAPLTATGRLVLMHTKRTPLAERLQAHVDQITKDNVIIVIERAGASARADRLTVEGQRVKRITIRPIKGRSSYFTAMHELGHHLTRQPTRRLDQEVVAWRWALDNAIVEPSPGVWKMIARCLDSYVRRAERWASMKLPDWDHDFWALLSEAKWGDARACHECGASDVEWHRDSCSMF